MLTISIKEARSTFSQLIDQAQRGETIEITRHGKQAARLVSANVSTAKLPSLQRFRARIKSVNTPLSETVIRGRDEDRF